MSRRLGGKRTISKYDMKIQRTIEGFYQLDGEGIRYEIVSFSKQIENGRNMSVVSNMVSMNIVKIIEDFNSRTDVIEIGERNV